MYLLSLFILMGCQEFKTQFDEMKQQRLNEIKLDSILDANHFDTALTYDSISLQHQNQALLSIGQDVNLLRERLSYRSDPNGSYEDHFPVVTDYLSLDDNLSINLEEGFINGALFFSVEQVQQQIFTFSGHWTIDVEITNHNEAKIIQQITTHLFPILKGHLKFENDWQHQVDKGNFVEHFNLQAPRDKGFWWTLNYTIEL